MPSHTNIDRVYKKLPKKKRKKKTIAGLVEDAAVLLQKIRRMELADQNGYCKCATCGKIKHWKEGDGGHYISRTKTATKLNPNNIHFQCKGCNGPQKHVAGPHYDKFMRDTYGVEFVDNLLVESKEIKKYARPEIEQIIVEFKAKVKELEARL